MKIALVLGTSTGGVGEHVRSLASGLLARGHRVTVLGPAETEERFGFARAGADFTAVEISSGTRPDRDLRAVRELRQHLAGPDVVHAHGLRAGFLAGRAQAPRLVCTWHNAVLVGGLRGRAYAHLERSVARSAAVTLAVSPDLVARARALGARDVRLAIVPAPELPAPASDARHRIRSELGAGARPVVLAVARLQAQKGQRVLLDAARAWEDRAPAPLIALAGEGPDRGALRDQAARLRLPVELLGHRRDVPDLLAAADVVVLPSLWEGQPLVVQEALRAGRPLVATDVGGVARMVGDAALLVRYGDTPGLSAAVARVLDDPELAQQLVEAGRLRAAGWPGLTQAVDQVEGVYSELASGS
jgi:glycosyltransferase involved in cell wall biosynthesis